MLRASCRNPQDPGLQDLVLHEWDHDYPLIDFHLTKAQRLLPSPNARSGPALRSSPRKRLDPAVGENPSPRPPPQKRRRTSVREKDNIPYEEQAWYKDAVEQSKEPPGEVIRKHNGNPLTARFWQRLLDPSIALDRTAVNNFFYTLNKKYAADGRWIATLGAHERILQFASSSSLDGWFHVRDTPLLL